MAHLIAAYSLAAIAILAYVTAIIVRRRRQRELEWSLNSTLSQPCPAELSVTNAHNARRFRTLGPGLILLAFILPWYCPTAAADSSAKLTDHSTIPVPSADAGQLLGELGGLVVDGARNNEPLPDVEVVLRGVRNEVLTPIATTRTDADGHFSFKQLDVANGALYVAGVNRDGIHYPGPRVGLFPDAPTARFRLICFPGTSGDSPLVALRHEVEIRVVGQSLDITESILVMNSSLRGFAGVDPGSEESTSLEIQPFPGFERVTFHLEQLGRNFKVVDGRLTTSLAWPPGQREIKFSYQLPIEHRQLTLARTLTLPTRYLQVRVKGIASENIQANLADSVVTQLEDTVQITHNREPLAQGIPLAVTLHGLPVPWTHHLRWLAPVGLVFLVVGSLAKRRWRHRVPSSPATKAVQPAAMLAHSTVAVKTTRSDQRSAARA